MKDGMKLFNKYVSERDDECVTKRNAKRIGRYYGEIIFSINMKKGHLLKADTCTNK